MGTHPIFESDFDCLTEIVEKMPKKKTGARKTAERQAERQREIRSADRGLAIHSCNALMECSYCQRSQKNRAFCYFCGMLQKIIMCGSCGMSKCMNKAPGGCLGWQYPEQQIKQNPHSQTRRQVRHWDRHCRRHLRPLRGVGLSRASVHFFTCL